MFQARYVADIWESPVKERDANEEGPAYAGPSMVNQRFQRPIMSFWALLPEAF